MSSRHSLHDAKFALTVAAGHQLPPPRAPEIAFTGRSNAGKSSAINALLGRRALAFVAKTPGKTRTIQFYSIGDSGFLVDLPGYGYAKVSDGIRRRWHRLLESYLMTRVALRVVVFVMDVRHPLTPLDRQMVAWISGRGLHVHALLTKCDKVPRGVALGTLAVVREQLAQALPSVSAQLFSSLSHVGVEEARSLVWEWCSVVPSVAPEMLTENRTNKNPRFRRSRNRGQMP